MKTLFFELTKRAIREDGDIIIGMMHNGDYTLFTTKYLGKQRLHLLSLDSIILPKALFINEILSCDKMYTVDETELFNKTILVYNGNIQTYFDCKLNPVIHNYYIKNSMLISDQVPHSINRHYDINQLQEYYDDQMESEYNG